MASSPDKPLIPTKTLTGWLGGISYPTLHRLKRSDPDFPVQYRIGGQDFSDPDDVRAYIEKKRQTKTSEAA